MLLRPAQHVLIVCDVSGSMRGVKLAELVQARDALLQALAAPENRDGFLVTVIEYNHRAWRVCCAESAQSLALPFPEAHGATNFEAALSETLEAVDDLEADWAGDGEIATLRPVVLFFTDGRSTATLPTIELLQEAARVIAIAYGVDADLAALSQISSNGRVHFIEPDDGALTAFFFGLGVALSRVLQQAA